MDLQSCYNASEDTFPLPLNIKQLYGPFGFPTRTRDFCIDGSDILK